MPLQPSQILNNRYRIVRLLGQGGFGAVYRAWDTNLNRPCAVKENLDTSPEAQRQFTREATILANLSHPNLPRVTDHFILPDQGQYLVMDFVEGNDLAGMMKSQGRVAMSQALAWIEQVADALSYLHSRSSPVVHRDVKPANIRITPDGQAMLVDFGLVKIFSPSMRTTLGARAVTPGYAPPEQYGQGNTDARTDLYALAATLYNLLTGKEPMESVQRMAGGQMPTAITLNPAVAPHVSAAIERAMRLEPSQRFGSVSEFKAALTAPADDSYLVRPAAPAHAAPNLAPPPANAVPPNLSPYPQPQARPPEARPPQTPATQVMSPPMPQAQSPYYPQAPAYNGYASDYAARPQKRRRSPLVWLALGSSLLLCLIAAAVGGVLVVGEQQNAQKTSQAQSTATQQALVQATSTQQAQLTQTAAIFAQRTAAAQATQQARDAALARLEANKIIAFGPVAGTLVHEADDHLIESYDADVNLKDFIVEARFFNPYGLEVGDWDYGFVLRHESKDTQYRFVIRSDKLWVLLNNTGTSDGQEIAQGALPDLDVSASGSNLVRLVFEGAHGMFFLNGQFISDLDLSARQNAGDILVTTGVYEGDEQNGHYTGYADFSIWQIP